MVLLERIKTGIPEFGEQATIVTNSYGGSKWHWIMSMVWCLVRYGARPKDYVRFEFHKKSGCERNRYLTIYRYFSMLKVFGYRQDGVYGKLDEYRTFSRYIHRPWMEVSQSTSTNQIVSFIKEHGVIIAKPDHGDQGHGVMKIASSEEAKINELLTSAKSKPWVIEALIENAPEIANFNPSSLNTVRVYTLRKKDGTIEVLAIMLRVGKAGSHVDNWGSGGVGYNFDVETGICMDYGRDKLQNPYIFHPGTKIQIVGYKLPRYKELLDIVHEMAGLVPQAKFVGWDIAITQNGFELVEMNCPGGHDFLQAFGKPFGHILKKELQ